MKVKELICMLCEQKSYAGFVNSLKDDNSRFAYRCQLCGLIQISPLPTKEDDENYYKSNEIIRSLVSEAEMSDEEVRLKYRPMGIKQAKRIKKLLEIKQDTKILEIGSGYGCFIEEMHKDGYDTDGIELSTEKCEQLRERTGIEMKSYNIMSNNEELEQNANKYDIICSHNTFEHIIEPNLFLKRIRRLMKSNGIIYIEVPNINGLLRQLSKPYDDFCFFRGHVSYYSPETLTYALQKNGFSDIKILGSQMYSLENAINWINNGVPIKLHMQLDLPEGLEFADEYFKDHVESRLISESIIGIAKKC